ncbi:hypothetical protein GW17_00049777 [Ensete ventricosum]|uniref:Uncharacterized protein n=1 Tax=Ensete ventricosum TaxID=4639 RepID=A0A444CQK2_ENSVE|nr:hypothetical protein B296_00034437 [Ensete ventricosum]RWV88162.1 hypothetical protein GW17_00049777 [Ensete ventricosum]RZS10297.1 hypothetical protein BHM03_00041498 [Ensete ventricosum]
MAEAYWRYADARHQAAAQAAAQAAVVPTPQPAIKRPRSEYPGTSHLAAPAIASFFRFLPRQGRMQGDQVAIEGLRGWKVRTRSKGTWGIKVKSQSHCHRGWLAPEASKLAST